MYKIGEFKEQLLSYIDSKSELDYEEKETWSKIVSDLTDYQDTVLQNIASSTPSSVKKSMFVHWGITSRKQDSPEKNFYYATAADDIRDPDFPNGNICSNDNKKMDGNWFIIGTGYLDCSYENALKLCGREKCYKGRTENGEFEYAIVLKNNDLHKEKLLYDISKYYNMNEAVPYAPMLRRLVYIETKKKFQNRFSLPDLQLTQNGLNDLLFGWRAIWNVEELSGTPSGVKNHQHYRYYVNPDEYIVPVDRKNNKFQISCDYDLERQREYICVSSWDTEVPKDQLKKVCISDVHYKKDILLNDIKVYLSPEHCQQHLKRVYSKSDIFYFLDAYQSFAKCIDVFTKCPDNFRVCTYELGYEYPLDSDYLCFSERPTVYLSFEKQDDAYFFDRVVYMIYVLQKQFPEYIWKGGYFV